MTPGNSFFSLIRAVGTRRGPGLGGTNPPQVLVEIKAAPGLFHLLICSNSIVYSQFATITVAQIAHKGLKSPRRFTNCNIPKQHDGSQFGI